jgi:hypothetical protein
MLTFTKIPKFTEVTMLNIDNTHITELEQWAPVGELQMGMARLAQYGGESAELAISATNSGQNVTARALVLTALVSFRGEVVEQY